MLTLFSETYEDKGEKANSSISTTSLKFEDAPARNAFEYLQMIYIARNYIPGGPKKTVPQF